MLYNLFDIYLVSHELNRKSHSSMELQSLYLNGYDNMACKQITLTTLKHLNMVFGIKYSIQFQSFAIQSVNSIKAILPVPHKDL